MDVENRLKEYRLEQNLTVCELARLSGVNHSTISNIENHSPQNITLIVAYSLAKALKVNILDLFIIK